MDLDIVLQNLFTRPFNAIYLMQDSLKDTVNKSI